MRKAITRACAATDADAAARVDVGIVFPDWLAVSTEGFAGMNAGRDPAHLVKELVQNALDAVSEDAGQIHLDWRPGESENTLLVTCRDNGRGMNNLADIRTVFYTSKTDSHLTRGRMGRGFKEMLCLAVWASVISGRKSIQFCVEDGKRLTKLANVDAADAVKGANVTMLMPWEPGVGNRLTEYFAALLPPAGVMLHINQWRIEPRHPELRIDATLPTELFQAGKWVRPSRNTIVELVPTSVDDLPMVYELGIPVCPVEWSQPYHVNVLQRVPMNPCRDAVASGYLTKLHRSCLPALLPQMSDEQVRQDWVGNAVPQCQGSVQQEVIRRGFGQNLARSVPKMGVRQYDEDAREIGINVIDTRQTSGGFRQILQEHIPTAKQAVDAHNHSLIQAAAESSFALDSAFDRADAQSMQRRRLIESVGGKQHVQRVMDFACWFCQKLLDGYEDLSICSVTLALLHPVNAIATWSSDDVLTLGIDTPWLWTDPLGERSLSVYIHEVAHHLNAHHGRDFHHEVEVLAGRAASVMLHGAHVLQQEHSELFPATPVRG